MLRNPISLSHFKTYALLAHTVPLNSFTYSIFISVCVCAIMSLSSPVRQLSRATHFVSLLFIFKASLCTEISSTAGSLFIWLMLIVCCPLFSLMLFHKCSVLLHQCIRKRRITRRVSARASSALLQWPSSSASCSSQPIRCCGKVWSSPAHCEPC